MCLFTLVFALPALTIPLCLGFAHRLAGRRLWYVESVLLSLSVIFFYATLAGLFDC